VVFAIWGAPPEQLRSYHESFSQFLYPFGGVLSTQKRAIWKVKKKHRAAKKAARLEGKKK
jgi:hypothetical protein